MIVSHLSLNSPLITRTGSEMSARDDVSTGTELCRCGDPEAGIQLTITKFVVYSALSSYSSHIVVISPAYVT